MQTNPQFWKDMELLIQSSSIIIDRPKNSAHPRYPGMINPLDYGYLENTTASDGGGVDVWLGTADTKRLTGILCTFDTLKRDAEIKILLGCSAKDVETIIEFHDPTMKLLYIPNPEV